MSLSKNKADLLRKFVDYKCEQCGQIDKILHCHRINRGYREGKYILRNIILLCKECHKKIHSGEFK